MKIPIIALILLCNFYCVGQDVSRHGYGIVNCNFVYNVTGYNNVDSIYYAESKNQVIDWFNRHCIYPVSVLDSCISENIQIGFKVINRDNKYIIDTLSVKIVEGYNNLLINSSINLLKKIPTWVTPKYNWKYFEQNNNLGFVISFNYKMIDCNETLWKEDVFPQNGLYTGYYKINGNKRTEGYFKNSNPDSLWIFYDINAMSFS